VVYLDTCYILKCYLTEPGSEEVREFTEAADGLASCVLARAEFAAAVHGHVRERKLTRAQAAEVTQRFRDDERQGYWVWHGLTERLLDDVARGFEWLPPATYLRTADAIHLCCARAENYREIHSNDWHLLAAAPHFGLKGVDVVRDDGRGLP
jgi:predicted nucleic acid-binding protein